VHPISSARPGKWLHGTKDQIIPRIDNVRGVAAVANTAFAQKVRPIVWDKASLSKVGQQSRYDQLQWSFD
jgi:hypothetical protein